jgi:hypothetical protein
MTARLETSPGALESKFGMQGTLHIFRRRIVNGGEIYQVNFTYTGSSFAKVFATQQELNEFLLTGLGLEAYVVDDLWGDIDRAGTGWADDIDVSPQQAAALGMSHSDVDF